MPRKSSKGSGPDLESGRILQLVEGSLQLQMIRLVIPQVSAAQHSGIERSVTVPDRGCSSHRENSPLLPLPICADLLLTPTRMFIRKLRSASEIRPESATPDSRGHKPSARRSQKWGVTLRAMVRRVTSPSSDHRVRRNRNLCSQLSGAFIRRSVSVHFSHVGQDLRV